MRSPFATSQRGNHTHRQLTPGEWRRTLCRFGTQLGLLLLLLILFAQATFAQGQGKQAERVDLLTVTVEAQDGFVQVAWQIGAPASEWNFTVYRGQSSEFTAAQPVDEPIFSSANSTSQVVDYSLSDSSSEKGAYYWLVVQGSDRTEQHFGPYQHQQQVALFLPLVFQGR